MFEELTALTQIDRDVSDAVRMDQLTALERVKAACAAAQVLITVDLAESQERVATAWRQRVKECADDNDFEGWRAAREQARQATVHADEREVQPHTRRRSGAEVGVAAQVALARREAPSRGAQHLSAALALVRHLPNTLQALQVGEISEWRAQLVVRETAVLAPSLQTAVDAELFDGLGLDGVGRLGDRELARRVRAIAYRLDAASVTARCRGAESQRRVTIRPAVDAMSYVTAYLPVAQGVAVHAALTRDAASARSAGDERSVGHLMADLLVERATGQPRAIAVPVEVQVVITDRALLAGDGTPAQVPGYGTVPAGWARHLVGETPAGVWLRRLYTHPESGSLVAMESTRRLFDGGLRRFLVARDGTCRTPWCDAPIRHLDHVVDHATGGPTSATNGQGLCVRCNHTKQHSGWVSRTEIAPSSETWRPQVVVTTTPTGHRYCSTPPPVLPGEPPKPPSHLERHWETLLAA